MDNYGGRSEGVENGDLNDDEENKVCAWWYYKRLYCEMRNNIMQVVEKR